MITYTVTLSNASAQATVVTITLTGSATLATDYALSGLTATGTAGVYTLTIPAGSLTGSFTVDPVGDAVFEGAETVIATISAASTSNTAGGTVNLSATTAAATGTIFDDGSANGAGGSYDSDLPTVAIAASPAALSEGDASESDVITYTVTLSNASAQATVVTITLTGSATLATDYALSGLTATGTAGVYTLTIPAGSLTGSFTVDPVGDAVFEGAETVIATISAASTSNTTGDTVNLSATTAAATGTILDDDNPALRIADVNVNEASPYVVFQVVASSRQTFQLALENGAIGYQGANDDPAAIDQQQAVAVFDYVNQIEYYNGTGWVLYNGGDLTVPAGSSVLLVRVPLRQDNLYEGAHAFTLKATSGGATITAKAIIGDFGSGAIFNDSGAENRTAVKDDDRALRVDSPLVNEGSQYVVFKVTGISGNVALEAVIGTGDGAAFRNSNGALIGVPSLSYSWDQGVTWTAYSGDLVVRPAGRTELLVRADISAEQDRLKEGSERFDLRVTGAGGPSSGVATIRDDGTGVIYTFNDVDRFTGTSSSKLDDDFDKDGITPTTESALATLVASQGIGDAKLGDLNNDGILDENQNALATLAWRDVRSFTAGNDGTLTDVRPIISLMVLEGTSDRTVSSSLQLENIQVVDFRDEQFGSAMNAVRVDETTQVRTVTLANGKTVDTPWDPIRFELGPQADAGSLTDLFPDRAGVQVRLYIDLRASGLNESDFNRYIKFISAEAIRTGELVDLDGKAVTKEGWYDFTQRTPGGDGARFVVEDGKLVGIELILTDNAFGDNDMQNNRIFDPGVLVFAEAALVVPPALPDVAEKLVEPVQVIPLDQGEGPTYRYLPFDSTLYALAAQAQPWTLSFLERMRDESELGNRFAGDLYTRQSDWRSAVIDSEQVSLSVLRGMPDQFAEADQSGSFVVPFDAFVHSRVDAWVGLSAELADGQPLPSWIVLDLKTGVFRFEPPKGWKGELQIKLMARDTEGREALTMFRFHVGEKAQARAGLSDKLREASQRSAQRAVVRPVAEPRAAKVPA